MATFNEFCAKVKTQLQKGFKKVSVEVEKAADTASLHIKLNTSKSKTTDLYEELGKLTYTQIRGEAAEGAEARVAVLVAEIEGKLAEQKEIRDELDRRKAEKEAKRAEEKTEFEATAEAPAEEETADEVVELPVDTDASAE
jgi:hypothetical protein